MLYLWPYITFFSFPLQYPYVLNALVPQKMLPQSLRTGSTRHLLPRHGITVSILAVMLGVVHCNTIVHPFTLADNRHYTFYVFRLLFRHPSIKYLAVPTYYICAWASIVTLNGYPCDSTPEKTREIGARDARSTKFTGTRKSCLPMIPRNFVPLPLTRPRTSFVLVWLLATSLSVVTAPLVEPRYFIIPWLMWRLHVPLSPRRTSTSSYPERSPPEKEHWWTRRSREEKMRRQFHSQSWLQTAVIAVLYEYDHRLIMETVWFCAVNLVVGNIFLHWGFEWEQEKGKVQRFMW